MRRLALLTIVAACGGGGTGPRAPVAPAQPVAPATAVAAEPAPDDLSAQLAPIRDAEHLPALGMAVWRGGALVAIGMTGVRKDGDPTPATVGDQWHLGSDTKAMTATLIGIYVDRGVLHWDDTIATLFHGETIDPGYATVTLDQLLGHRGGLPADPPVATLLLLRADPDLSPAKARGRIVTEALAQPPAQTPGTLVYSNVGYMVAATALERATGKTWEELIVADLFTPLGMTSCGLGPPGTGDQVDQPWGHRTKTVDGAITLEPLAPGDPDADNATAYGPAGAVHCTLRDWGKFLTLHAAATPTLVTAETFAHLHQPLAGSGVPYGFGWVFTEIAPGYSRMWHTGSNTKWYAIAVVDPTRDVAIAVVTNRRDEGLLAAIVPVAQPYLKPAAPGP